MSTNPNDVVAKGYDLIADTYLEKFGVSSVRWKWLQRLVSHLPADGACVLDLGCGAGTPVALHLARLGHSVFGVDGSSEQVARARKNVPEATFIEANMCEVRLEAASFDAVGAFYSINHVPRERQEELISRIGAWLKPGGVFVGSFGTGTPGNWTGEWLGASMFFGNDSQEGTRQALSDAGLSVRDTLIEKQDNEDAAFYWVVATKDHAGRG